MSTINLYTDNFSINTVVPNDFIDYYMPYANGEFVKVYLYILRCIVSRNNISISSIADILNHTENDVIRALRYWQEQKLLYLEVDSRDNIISLHLLDVPREVVDEELVVTETVIPEKVIPLEDAPMKKPTYTPAQLKVFSEQEQLKQLLYITEKYIGKPLSHNDINTIIFFYDSLKLPVDVIEYLIEYCVTHGHRSFRYIEKVGITWAENNITNLEKAKAHASMFNKNYFSVFKAFGINNRNPGDIEIKYMKRWFDEYKFELDIVLDACKRTLQAIHQPSFEYADTILKNWFNNKVKNFEDISKLDAAFSQNKNATKQNTTVNKPKTSNKFSNFKQRSYDYNDIEKKLAAKRKSTNYESR